MYGMCVHVYFSHLYSVYIKLYINTLLSTQTYTHPHTHIYTCNILFFKIKPIPGMQIQLILFETLSNIYLLGELQ